MRIARLEAVEVAVLGIIGLETLLVSRAGLNQPELSVGMSQVESYYWVFVTSDPASKVAAFCKTRTGIMATAIEGMYMFPLSKGPSPYFPDHGIVIEPNKQLTAGPILSRDSSAAARATRAPIRR